MKKQVEELTELRKPNAKGLWEGDTKTQGDSGAPKKPWGLEMPVEDGACCWQEGDWLMSTKWTFRHSAFSPIQADGHLSL